MLQDASRYEILFDLKQGEYHPAEVGGIRTRTVRAGGTVEVECYPLTRIGPAAKAEAHRRKRQSVAMEAANRRNAEKKIRRYIEANFTREDWVITLTWDYGAIDRFQMSGPEAAEEFYRRNLPTCEEDARRALNNYWRRIKTKLRQLGRDPGELMHLYVLEITRPKTDGHEHYHFHAVVHAPGLTDRALKGLWPQGFVRADRLSLRDEGPARLAAYMTKQHTTEAVDGEGKRLRRWGHSQNLKEPAVTVSDRRISRRRAALVAEDVRQNGRAIFEALYPGYQCVETPTVRYSDFVAGAYISARLRKIDHAQPWARKKDRGNGP